jgi:hypothetical protein
MALEKLNKECVVKMTPNKFHIICLSEAASGGVSGVQSWIQLRSVSTKEHDPFFKVS